jgi:uncharacterized circularly permuted ATP-grasp superfamily protein/uncharacterized alpha-E superfamily protein
MSVVQSEREVLTRRPHYDELRDAGGAIRPHWRPLTDTLAAMSAEEYTRRRAAADGVIRDNGVTYNVYDEDGGHARPWELDVVPFVIDAADWRIIEAGIVQRAMLANEVLQDIYGSQRLIAEGHLPPHLVFGHPQFLRPLVGVAPAHGVHVHLYSADLARTPDGSWIVLASRADAPSGLGYALENRIVVGQTFPDLFAGMRIQRLASFFQTYRDHVQALAGTRGGRVVLLSSGPYNEAYFEHAYLAHYLGLTLVEGDDLAVRDGQVFLKTLVGLERVGVIFRRVDSDFCDPLELRGDSALGVPGLTEAVRTNSVVLANALGGGVVESPALDAYLPSLARAVLGEELCIPDIPTVWCGTEWGRKEALARLDRVMVRDAFDARPLFSRASSARLGGDLSAAEHKSLLDKLERRGATIVTQDIAPLGMAPVFEQGRLGTRPVSLKVFAAWTPQGYVVMPGGLARVAPDEGARALSMQSGAISKDAWVLGEGPVDTFTLLRDSDKPVAILRTGNAPPSRAMDNLFWLGRYAERAENLMRVLRAIVLRLGEDVATTPAMARRLLQPFARSLALSEGGADEPARLSAELHDLVYDRGSPRGLQTLLINVRRTAWAARDRISPDTWRTIHTLTGGEASRARIFDSPEMLSYLDAMVRRAAALSGLSAENMTRGPNWLFVDLGRRIERAMHLAWLVKQTLVHGETPEDELIRVALEIADSSMTFRARYFNAYQAAPVIDTLLFDPTNPRAVSFQLDAIAHHVGELPRATAGQRRDIGLKLASEAQALLAKTDPVTIAMVGEDGARRHLDRLTDEIEQSMSSVTDAITDAYFQHSVRRRTGAARREAV